MGWKVFSLTYVLYEQGSVLSLLSALLALVPQSLVIVMGTWGVATREIEPLLLLAGQVVSTVLNNVLKRIIQQPRPIGTRDGVMGV